MGLEDDIFRTEGYFWIGSVRGGFHYDEEANVYVQLSGESDVILIPQNYTDYTSGGVRHLGSIFCKKVQEQYNHTKNIPMHVFRLKPGDAITFPGRTYHWFLAQTPDRLALNFFFIPKWRRMEYHDADWYSQEAKPKNGLQRLAVRQLWARSFVRLYNETDKGIIFMGMKNEYI